MRNDFSWLDYAACKGMSLNLFFPTGNGIQARRQSEPAIMVCRECPVKLQCAEYGKREQGVWAGKLHIQKQSAGLE